MAKKPFGLQWHITDKCDQRCQHCYIYAGKDIEKSSELSLEILKDIFYNFLDTCKLMNRIPSISITGGDPLLYKDIWNLLEVINKENVYFSILGNPFHLTDDIANRLKKLGCTNYQMSLDGLEETHDSIRKKGSFKETIEKIAILRSNHIPSSIMTTVSRTNIGEIPELVDIIVENKVDRFGFARYCPNADDESLMVSPYEYREFLDKMWHKYLQYQDADTLFNLKDHLWKLYLYEEGIFKIDSIKNDDKIILDGCQCGISHMTVLADGTVYACRRSNTPIGKVPDQSLYDIFFGNKMEQYRQFEKFKACSNCELYAFCRGCPSVANCAIGDFYAKDPQCWKE